MSEQDEREKAVTDAVVASFAEARDERLREVVQSLVRHLHAFAREVRLTQAEWEAGVRFLTRVGHVTDERRQEFILLSDVLGLSMLTSASTRRGPGGDRVDGVRTVLRRGCAGSPPRG
jgi:hydroxyquinol 1,2-dioxygenase